MALGRQPILAAWWAPPEGGPPDFLQAITLKSHYFIVGVTKLLQIVQEQIRILGVPREAHPLRVGRCASDLCLWTRRTLYVVQWSVVTPHVAPWSVVPLRDGVLVFMQMVVFGLCAVSCEMMWWFKTWAFQELLCS